jgi:hypothetical protein
VEYDGSAAVAEVVARIDFFPGNGRFCVAGIGRKHGKPRRHHRARGVSDPNSGLAINGFDPVAYFTESLALPQRGQRVAFVAHPDVYMPRFGGYDPIAVARGASAPSHAELWIIAEQRLYLFYNAAACDAFSATPAPPSMRRSGAGLRCRAPCRPDF